MSATASPELNGRTPSDVEKDRALHAKDHDNASDSALEHEKLSAANGDAEKQEHGAAAAPAPAPGADFPDGGRQAWLTVLGSACCLFVSFGWINCVGVFQDYYSTHQLRSYTQSEISWIPTLQVFFMLFGGPFAGKVFDDYGPKLLLLVGTLLHVFGLMMTSLSKQYYQIMLSQAVCSAIGASLIFYPAFTCTATWFFRKRGMAIGLIVAGSSLGGVIFPIMVVHLIPEVGFGWTMRICAFLILGLLIVANLTVTSRIKPTPRPLTFRAFWSPFTELTFALLVASVFMFYWGMFQPITFIVVEARTHGMSERLANYLVPILNAASLFGRTIPSILADRFGLFNMTILMCGLTTVLILGLWLPATGHAAIIVFAALIGFSTGAGISLIPAICAKVSPIKDIGVRTGVAIATASFAGLTGSPIGGKIITDDHGNFKYMIVFAGVASGIGTFLFAVTRWTFQGAKGWRV